MAGLEPFLIRQTFVPDLSATTLSLSLSLENKYLSPRFNPWPQNQFAAAKDLAIFEPCALLPGRDAEDPWKVGL